MNYARIDDFLYLEKEGYPIEDHVCIARYGKIFRGNKARYAENFGCIALILFSDEGDYAQEWIEPRVRDRKVSAL